MSKPCIYDVYCEDVRIGTTYAGDPQRALADKLGYGGTAWEIREERERIIETAVVEPYVEGFTKASFTRSHYTYTAYPRI